MPVLPKTSLKTFLVSAAQQWRQLLHWCVSQLERERRSQIVVALLVSVVCAGVFAESVVTTRTQRNKWSTNASVVVATTDIAANELLTADNTQLVTLPLALIAADALREVPPHTRTRIALTANTPLTESLVVPSSESLAIPSGWRVIALPSDITTPALLPGDRVDIVIGTSVASPDCMVVSLSPLTIALPADVIPTVTAASRVGEVFIAARK